MNRVLRIAVERKGRTVVERFPMQEVDAVFEWLKDGCIRSRAVLYNDVA